MAPKQAEKKREAPTKELTPLERFGFPATLLVLSAAVSSISQLTLAPVYGAIPSAVNHTIALIFSVAVGYGSWIADGARPKSQHIWITVFPFWVPLIQFLLLPYSKNLGPVTGAIFNGGISCHAILVASIYALAEALAPFDLTPYVGSRVGDAIKASLLVPAFLGMEKKVAGWISLVLSKSKMLTPVHFQLAIASTYAIYFPSWYLLLGLPPVLHTVIMNPHFSIAAASTSLSTHNWTMIDRQWSTTGYISVLDSFNEHYRVLRCDHSLLGGEWLLTEQRKKEGWKANEPIYSVFEMLEAVRLMQSEENVPDSEAQALVIGVGIGTAPKALITHGIDTTVVELDPTVHAFATRYFNLPTNHTAILQDATSWARVTASQEGSAKYDYIIHDVFTGGAEPLALFNADFLTNLRTLLKPHGAIALNYAGDLVNPLTRSVLHTIDHVFSGRSKCKIFRDGPPERHALTEGSHEDFLNMVIFCKNSAGDVDASSQAIGTFFRAPRQADYLGRHSAKHYLLPKPEHEIPFPDPSDVFGDDPSSSDFAKPHQKPPMFISLLEPLRALRDDPSFWWKTAPETHTHAPYTQAEMKLIELGDEKKYAKQQNPASCCPLAPKDHDPLLSGTRNANCAALKFVLTAKQEESAIRHWYIMRSVLPDAVWELW